MGGSMVAVLAIAVLAMTVALVVTILARRPQEAGEQDLAPAIQQAASQVASQAMADLQRLNEESRKVDAKAAEATLDKRQAEIKALAERIAKGQEKIEKEVQRRGETDLQTR